jgi:uncharacterized protein (UPF0333 family)
MRTVFVLFYVILVLSAIAPGPNLVSGNFSQTTKATVATVAAVVKIVTAVGEGGLNKL